MILRLMWQPTKKKFCLASTSNITLSSYKRKFVGDCLEVVFFNPEKLLPGFGFQLWSPKLPPPPRPKEKFAVGSTNLLLKVKIMF